MQHRLPPQLPYGGNLMTRSKTALWIFVACLYGIPCVGDNCAGDSNYQNVPCFGPHGCQSSAYVNRPQSGHEFLYSCEGVSCCGQLITDCTQEGDCAQSVALRNPEVRRQLTELSANSTVMVANCSGEYVPYEPPGAGSRVRSSALVDDHILRD